MQSTISTLIICILTSIITILGYHAFVSNQEAQVSADNYSYAVSNNDLNLGGNLREHFYSAKPNDFISSAKSSIPAVVQSQRHQVTNLKKVVHLTQVVVE